MTGTEAVEPFRIHVAESRLAGLRARLAATRWPDEQPVGDWSQGVPLHYARQVCAYWADGYSWRRVENSLNALPQFRTRIDGEGVHFLHVRSPHPGALPLLLLHGWPGSVIEYLDIIRPLTHPEDPADAFDVICPSMPGFGFSDRPRKTGWGVERIAAAYAEMMSRLGYERYAAHGGDWGSFIAAHLGHTVAGRVAGIHLTMPFAPQPQEPVELSERDAAGLEAMKSFVREEGGYSAIQSTRPQTLGYGLTDSPVAQFAWIAEKFWTWADHDGDLDAVVSRDRLLDTVTLFWLTATGTSAARLYWESHGKVPMLPVGVPTGCLLSPKDARMPQAWVARRFTDLRHWRDLDKGGHFPALEQPDLLVGELREFFRPLR